jgi:sphinganine-1-phosphate aldolase
VLLYQRAYARINALFLTLPGVSSQVDRQVSAAVREIAAKIAPDEPEATRYLTIPKQGWQKEKLSEELLRLSGLPRTRWEDGKVSGAVYHGEDSLLEIQAQAMKLWSVANPIHPDVFPAVRKMEAEIVKMVGDLFHAPKDEGCGVTTSGGTESILMAVLSARRKGEIERGITEPEMIIPSTAHAAFQKAASYFKIKLHQVACPAPSYKASIPAITRLITPNTILLVGSMPEYAHGIADDIPALSRLALKHSLPLHVDCCLGSFLLPFLSRAGFPSPYAEAGGFDFQQPGVTSISVDTHKYGFAPKGNSVVLYRTQQLRRYQYFISPDWAGGVYASPSIAGSRPGSLIAGCWASLMAVGEDGYTAACHKIITTRQTIQNAITEHPVLSSCLAVLGEPLVSVVAFESVDAAIDIYDIADAMGKKGWHLNAGQKPPMIHVAVTMPMTRPEAVDELIGDLVKCVEAEKEAAVERMRAGGPLERKKGDAAALYGVAGKVAGGALVGRLVEGYMDTLYKA